MKTIRLLLTALTALVTTFGMAQTTIIPPYNPNSNEDPLIEILDLLALLSIYGDEFYPAEILVDGQSLELYIQQLEEAAANATGDSVLVPVMIPGTAVGQILYWSGTSWQLLDPGEEGQVLKSGLGSVPTWEHVSLGMGTIIGCADSLACNYHPEAVLSLPTACDFESCLGCTDPLYLEYVTSATIDDGSCLVQVVQGCTNPFYLEFDESANQDDGSCATLIVPGCTDPLYLEFDSLANVADGSCLELAVFGCTDDDYVEYNPEANSDDGSCSIIAVNGCTDSLYVEYNPEANLDDGSCSIVRSCSSSGAFCYLNGQTIYEVLAAGAVPVDSTLYLIITGVSEELYDVMYVWDNVDPTQGNAIYSGFGDADGLVVVSTTGEFSITIAADAYVACGSGLTSIEWEAMCSFSGCTDEGALNYESWAPEDDGSCLYAVPGCGDVSSIDYQGYEYPLVSIGGRCWFGANLRADSYSNGDPILTSTDGIGSFNLEAGLRYVYGSPGYPCSGACDSLENVSNYGFLYDWFAVNDGRGLCPSGFSVPSDDDWNELEGLFGLPLIDYAFDGSRGEHSGALKAGPMDAVPWNGSNESGLSLVPGGAYNGYYNDFGEQGSWAFLWSSDLSSARAAWRRGLSSSDNGVNRGARNIRNAYSVRCVEDLDASGCIDPDGDGVCLEDEVGGCTDTNASNFDPLATQNDGSCDFCDGLTDLDYQGHVYGVRSIARTCWFEENLQATAYSNGESIPANLTDSEWSSTLSGAMAYPQNDAALASIYGGLYNWYAVDDPRGLCPSGWHVSTDEEWTVMAEFLGESDAAHYLKAPSGNTPSWNGSNGSGFAAFPSGMRWTDGGFESFNAWGHWWTGQTTTFDPASAIRKAMVAGYTYIDSGATSKRVGSSVRCVKD